mmetsp:Transcript_42144/g.48492  ORF Transcript_42144/g.48492 Transcript_42144/m.48492 type:complete len:373 (+) Transcript_42144:604-1722(+)
MLPLRRILVTKFSRRSKIIGLLSSSILAVTNDNRTNKDTDHARTIKRVSSVGSDRSGDDINHISDLLLLNPRLKRFDLQHNNWKIDRAENLINALRFNSSVTHFDIQYNFIKEAALALADVLELNRSLIHLDLRCCQLSSKSMQTIARRLESNQHLKYLNLHDNLIESREISSLARMLLKNRRIEELDLGANHIQDYDVSVLYPSLCLHPALRSLDISCNKFGNEAAGIIAGMLSGGRNRSKITNLSLRGNHIYHDGIILIFKALESNRFLSSLDLAYTYMNDSCLPVMLAMLTINRTLLRLDITRTLIMNAIQKLPPILEQNPALSFIDMRENKLSPPADLRSPGDDGENGNFSTCSVFFSQDDDDDEIFF